MPQEGAAAQEPAPAPESTTTTPAMPEPASAAIRTPVVAQENAGMWVQLGAFSSAEAAESFRDKVTRDLDWIHEPVQVVQRDGLSRVRLGAPVREYPYRAVRVALLPEEPYSEDDAVVRSERQSLLDLYRRLAESPAQAGGAAADLPFVALVNGVCMTAPLEAEERLELLALDSVIERGHRACELATRRLRSGVPPGPGEHN